MRDVHTREYEDGELALGWPTWDPNGESGRMSVKYRYCLGNGRASRGAPEVPVAFLPDMVEFAAEHGALTQEEIATLRDTLNRILRTRGHA